MSEPHPETRLVQITPLGERLSVLRLCEATALAAVGRSLAQHGQLSALTLFATGDGLEIIDGFKRVRAARALGWSTLLARIDDVGSIDAKLRLRELHDRRELTELEEAWLVRSLYRDDHVVQPEIARRMGRHRSWVWRRLMLVESLDPDVQADVRLGLIAARSAVAVSRLPRGNQQTASAVVIRRGLTVRQTDLLVAEVLEEPDAARREALLARRLTGPALGTPPGPRPSRATRSEADWIAADILRIHALAARLEARLLATPLATFAPAATELMHDALARLSPVLRALDGVIGSVTGERGSA
ncbi:MAG TPA: ParB/RepB/Spo0J family partition protein [Kofleriaceae bacterium]|jgi:ParB-like chromosome segregation protein Spo0J|nr:ParB/RepB/Spo0J family partition protein [Kofleriaceae bacterium]